MIPLLAESDIRSALRDCYDPEHQLNIVDLGVLESITVARDLQAPGAGVAGVPPRFAVAITLVPSTAEEAPRALLLAQVHHRLAGIAAISKTTVHVLEAPLWTAARISPAGREALGLDRVTLPILGQEGGQHAGSIRRPRQPARAR